jgi:hypothetical protein
MVDTKRIRTTNCQLNFLKLLMCYPSKGAYHHKHFSRCWWLCKLDVSHKIDVLHKTVLHRIDVLHEIDVLHV